MAYDVTHHKVARVRTSPVHIEYDETRYEGALILRQVAAHELDHGADLLLGELVEVGEGVGVLARLDGVERLRTKSRAALPLLCTTTCAFEPCRESRISKWFFIYLFI